jgi:putative pyruvate formate lyase activating enzyme
MRLTPDQIRRRAKELFELASPCRLCPRACGADRSAGEKGACGADDRVMVALHGPHHGEEPPISGSRGSGTVFFANCPLRCVFCQNHEISHGGLGNEVKVTDLTGQFLELQSQGVHNLNLVTAGHYLPWVVAALAEAAEQGLDLPVVYNSGGYESVAALAHLDGVVDVYLPDLKHADPARAKRYSGVSDYVPASRSCFQEMFAQAGPLRLDPRGLARQGVLVRHLVLPGGAADARAVLAWLAGSGFGAVPVSLMAQYLPRHRAARFPEIDRPLDPAEYAAAAGALDELGLEGFVQELAAATDELIPDFSRGRMDRKGGPRQTGSGERTDFDKPPGAGI